MLNANQPPKWPGFCIQGAWLSVESMTSAQTPQRQAECGKCHQKCDTCGRGSEVGEAPSAGVRRASSADRDHVTHAEGDGRGGKGRQAASVAGLQL